MAQDRNRDRQCRSNASIAAYR